MHVLRALLGRVEGLAGLEHPSVSVCPADVATAVEHGKDEPLLVLPADLSCQTDVRSAVESVTSWLGPPRTVIHLAAQASAGRSFADPAATYLTNVVGTANLLEALADHAAGARVLIPGTALAYAPEAANRGPLDETAAILPSNHYGASKYAQEQVARVFAATRDLTVYVTRAFNHIGPGQGPDFALPAFARQVAMAERHGGGTIRVGNLNTQRDFLDVRDVVGAYLTVLDKGEPGLVYNVASGRGVSVRELLDILLESATCTVDVEVDESLLRPVEIPTLVGDASRLRALGWRPLFDLRQTVRDTLDWWRTRASADAEDIGTTADERHG